MAERRVQGPGVPVTVRCYAELNDFLPRHRRQSSFVVRVGRHTTTKDLLESLGVPHTEVDLIVVNGESETFDRALEEGDRVAAYPVFEAFDIAPISRLRPEPLRDVRFVLDGHLGRLAAFLRLAGFDTLYRAAAEDAELAAASAGERRILLTRDRGLLMRRAVSHGHFVHATRPEDQLREIVDRFDLRRSARPFTRCTRCNTGLRPATPDEVAEGVPARSLRVFDSFLHCPACRRTYWKGSHYPRLRGLLLAALGPE